MKQSDINELVERSHADGARLYQVSEWLYKLLLLLTVVVALLGVVLAFAAASRAGPGALILGLASTSIVVLLLYAFAVLSTHISKVLVHLLFASLANLKKERE